MGGPAVQRGQKQDGRCEPEEARLSLVSCFPWSPQRPLVTGVVVRGFALKAVPVPSPPAPPAAPTSIQLEVSVLHLCCPRGTQPARAKLGGSNGCTCAAPPTPPRVPQVLAGPAAAVATPAATAVPLRTSLERGSASMERLPVSPAQIQGLDLVPCWDPCEAMPLQGDLVEQGRDPPQFLPCLDLGVPSPHPCAGFGGAPAVALRTLQTSVPLAQLACAIVLGHCSPLHCHAGQPGIPCHWRWISSSLLPPVPLSTPLVLCCCDSGAGSGSSGWLGAGVPHCV